MSDCQECKSLRRERDKLREREEFHADPLEPGSYAHSQMQLEARLAEHERVRREVAEELLQFANGFLATWVTDRAAYARRLASRLSPGGEETGDANH
jgi:hypothetical protein